jgi:hypothetical protein
VARALPREGGYCDYFFHKALNISFKSGFGVASPVGKIIKHCELSVKSREQLPQSGKTPLSTDCAIKGDTDYARLEMLPAQGIGGTVAKRAFKRYCDHYFPPRKVFAIVYLY